MAGGEEGGAEDGAGRPPRSARTFFTGFSAFVGRGRGLVRDDAPMTPAAGDIERALTREAGASPSASSLETVPLLPVRIVVSASPEPPPLAPPLPPAAASAAAGPTGLSAAAAAAAGPAGTSAGAAALLPAGAAAGLAGAPPPPAAAPPVAEEERDILDRLLMGDAGVAAAAAAAADPAAASAARLDLQAAARWVEQALPFAVLLCIMGLHTHHRALTALAWLTLVLVRANEALRRQVALREERSSVALAILAAALAGQMLVVYALLGEYDPWRQLLLLPPLERPGVLRALWLAMVNYHVVQYGTVAVKSLLLLLPALPPRPPLPGALLPGGGGRAGGAAAAAAAWATWALAAGAGACLAACRGGPPAAALSARLLRRQAHWLTLCEYVSSFYRALVPIPLWYAYFRDPELGRPLASLLAGLFLAFKISNLLERAALVRAAARAAAGRGEGGYGRPATAADLAAMGGPCAICHEDPPPAGAVVLRCSHVFCADCVETWFERERQEGRRGACPLCRAVVKPPGLRSFGDGSTQLILTLF